MDITTIVSRVRLAIDEETVNNAYFDNASAGDSTKMDNIIKASIGTALHWVCLHAPTEMLAGMDESASASFIADIEVTTETGATPIDIGDVQHPRIIGCYFSVASDFLRLVRVRGDNWHRAIMVPISEDSEEYLQLYDANGAEATNDRPQAAVIHSATKRIEVYPKPTTVSYTYIKDPLAEGTDYSTTAPVIPAKAQAALIYYIAFLVLSAYGDPRAARMLEIATMNISINP